MHKRFLRSFDSIFHPPTQTQRSLAQFLEFLIALCEFSAKITHILIYYLVLSKDPNKVKHPARSLTFFCPFVAIVCTPIIAMYGTFGHLAAQTKFGPQLLEEDLVQHCRQSNHFFYAVILALTFCGI